MDGHNSIFTKIAVFTVLSIMIVLFFTIGLRVFTRFILIERLSMDNAFTKAVMFDNESLADPDKRDIKLDAKGKLTKYSKENVVLYMNFTELAKLYNHTLSWSIEKYGDETVVANDEGYLLNTIHRMNVSPYVWKICELNTLLEENELPLLYAALPGKIPRSESELTGAVDFSNQNIDDILNGIRAEGIEVLDMRDRMEAFFEDYYGCFFVTDHHWRPETALWAAEELTSYLNEKHGYDFDTEKINPENFRKETYDEIFLGANGRKLTLSVADPEALNLYYPNYPVDLRIEIPSMGIDKTGDFSIYYHYEMLEPGDYYQTIPYCVYAYGDQAMVKMTNNDCENDVSVLVIGDSMDNAMLPFMSLNIKQITAIDVRAFKEDLETFIPEHKDEYDMVIITNSVMSVTDPNLYDY